MSRSLILLSGGLDSALLANRLLLDGVQLQALFIDTGQTAATAELSAAHKVCARLDLPLDVVGAPALRAAFTSSSGAVFSHNPNPGRHVLPLGSMLLFGIAIPYADSRGISDVYIGYNSSDAKYSAEYAQPWLDHLAQVAAAAARPSMRILAPLLSMKFSEIIAGSADLQGLASCTYSCILQGPDRCGRCRSCESSAAKFESLRLRQDGGV